MRSALVLVLVAILAVAAWLFLSPTDPAPVDPASSGSSSLTKPDAGDPLAQGAGSAPNASDLDRDTAPSNAGDGGAAESVALAGRISGQVLDPGGNPLPGANVAFLRRSAAGAFLLGLDHTAPVDRQLQTDAQGRYFVSDLPAGGAWDLCAWHPDFCFTAGPAVSGLAESAQELPPIQLGDGYLVEGVTVDEQGSALAGVTLDFYLEGWQPLDASAPADPFGRFFRTESEADGSFQFSGMGDGAWTLRARSEGRGDGWVHAVLLLPRQQVPPLRVVLGPEYPLSGVVRTPAGAPVSGAAVSLRPTAAGTGPAFEMPSDAEGRFRLRGVPEGAWTLSASCAGYLPARPQELDAAARADLLLELQPIGGIRGKVLSAQGQPLLGATLQLWSTMRGNPPFQPLEQFQTVSDPAGQFEVLLSEPGTFVLLIRAEGFAPVWTPLFQAHPDSMDLGELRLSPAARAQGKLVAAHDQSPIAGARISVRSPSWDPTQAGNPFAAMLLDATDVPPVTGRTGADGSFSLGGLPLMPCLLVFEDAGIVTLSVPLQPAAGAQQDLGELRAQAASTLIVRGLDQDGNPLAGGTVLLQRDEAGLNQTTHMLDADGRARIGGMPSGDWWISVVEGGGLFGRTSERQRLWLAPGAREELELRLEAPR